VQREIWLVLRKQGFPDDPRKLRQLVSAAKYRKKDCAHIGTEKSPLISREGAFFSLDHAVFGATLRASVSPFLR